VSSITLGASRVNRHGINAARWDLADFIRSIPNSPEGLLEFVTGLLLAHGYIVIIVGAALDNFGLPASGDVVLFAGGWFANDGQAALGLVMLSGFAGALMSDHSVYWIGRTGGRPLIQRILKLRVLRILINENSLERVERYYEDHGGKTVLADRFGPGLRSMTPLFAGVTETKYRKFVPYNLTAVTIWAVVYTLIGYVFGEYWDELLSVARSFGYGIVSLVALALILYVLHRRSRKNRK
jgi:membrane protein DedA with SNARE-associated domain